MNDNVFIFRRRNRGLLTTGSYSGRDTSEELFLIIFACVKCTVLPIIMCLSAFGYSSLFVVGGVLFTGIGAGLIKYNWFPYRITSYFNAEDLPWSYGELTTITKKDETDFKDAA